MDKLKNIIQNLKSHNPTTISKPSRLNHDSVLINLTTTPEQPISIEENEQIVDELRKLNEPIRLFGETNLERKVRFTKINSQDVKVRLEYIKPNAKIPIQSVYKPEYDVNQLEQTLFIENPDLCYVLVAVYLKRILLEWEQEPKNKIDEKHLVQTKTSLKPFFRHLRNKTIDSEVIQKISGILALVRDRKYIDACSLYLKLAIGNAAWPIGVTMVGIHERSGQEKINSNHIAHVLNDEEQRKWIQCIKRVITFMQRKYPPSDPTKIIG